jgi:hypothetical protein
LNVRGYEELKKALSRELTRHCRFGDIEKIHVSRNEIWANVTFEDDRDARLVETEDCRLTFVTNFNEVKQGVYK